MNARLANMNRTAGTVRPSINALTGRTIQLGASRLRVIRAYPTTQGTGNVTLELHGPEGKSWRTISTSSAFSSITL